MEVKCSINTCLSLDCPHAVPHEPIHCGSKDCNHGHGCDCREYPKECGNDPVNKGCEELS